MTVQEEPEQGHEWLKNAFVEIERRDLIPSNDPYKIGRFQRKDIVIQAYSHRDLVRGWCANSLRRFAQFLEIEINVAFNAIQEKYKLIEKLKRCKGKRYNAVLDGMDELAERIMLSVETLDYIAAGLDEQDSSYRRGSHLEVLKKQQT